MKLFGKKSATTEAPAVVPTKPSIDPNTVIYTMPDKFLLPDKPPFWTGRKIWSIVVLVVLVLVGVVYWLISGLLPTAPAPTATIPEVTTPVPLTPITPVEPTPESTPVTPEPPPTPETPVPTPTAPPATVPVVLPRGADSDGDDLSDVEERLFGTSPETSDSDGDTFADRSEIIQGYNPKGPGVLEASGIFKVFASSSDPYKTLVPASWTTSESGGTATFVSTDGERVIIMTTLDDSGASLKDWYIAQHPEREAGTVAAEALGSYSGIFSIDRRSFTFSLPSAPKVIFTVTYDVGNKTETNYNTTFELIIRSLEAA